MPVRESDHLACPGAVVKTVAQICRWSSGHLLLHRPTLAILWQLYFYANTTLLRLDRSQIREQRFELFLTDSRNLGDGLNRIERACVTTILNDRLCQLFPDAGQDDDLANFGRVNVDLEFRIQRSRAINIDQTVADMAAVKKKEGHAKQASQQ